MTSFEIQWNGAYASTFSIYEGVNASYRLLIRFPSIHKIIHPDFKIVKANLKLNFANWGSVAKLDACVITKPWDTKQIVE
jgi:hypothetical protein